MLEIDQFIYKTDTFKLAIDQLRIHKGLTILVGENGAGKTTFLKALATVITDYQGTVTYKGLSLSDGLSYIRSQIGFVPTGVAPYEHMTVRKFLDYMGHLKGVYQSETVDQLLRSFDLWHLRKTKIRQLSQGQTQKAAISQAFIGHPAFIFLDEPLDYLDTKERKRLINILMGFSQHCHVVVATHDFSEWEDQADDVLWLTGGMTGFHGSTHLWKKGHPYKVFVYHHLRDRALLPSRHVLSWKKNGDGTFRVRAFSLEPLKQSHTEVPATLEDAYFIRRFMKAYETRG